MSVERVKDFFEKEGIADRIQEFDVSSATVELAAQALNCDGCRIAKTLSFHVDDRVVLIVAAGDAKIDNRKYKDNLERSEDAGLRGSGASDRTWSRRRLPLCGKRGSGGISGRIPETVRDSFSRLRKLQQRHRADDSGA